MPNWTQNQQNAIHSTNGSILVSASAGSGKTAVLVERVISRITDKKNPTPADRMLVVTYTKAAAAEMKERIIARLYDLIKANPYDSHLRYQQLKLQNAHISTIHSFCNQLVRENFYSLGVSKDFRIADDGELSVLKNDAIDDVFDTLYSKENNGSVTLYNFNSIFPYGLTVPLSEINALARFKIDKSQIHLLLCGIKKVRITTIPIVHEIEFKEDEIGCKLYEKLSNAVSSECAF